MSEANQKCETVARNKWSVTLICTACIHMSTLLPPLFTHCSQFVSYENEMWVEQINRS